MLLASSTGWINSSWNKRRKKKKTKETVIKISGFVVKVREIEEKGP